MLRVRALVVDDDHLTANAVRSVLRKRPGGDVEVTLANSLGNAVSAVSSAINRDEPFDVVILDLLLPDCPIATATYSRMRQGVGSDVPIIVLSGEVDEELRRWLRDQGAYRVLDKPFQIAELNDAVDSSQEARGSDPPRDSTMEYLTMQLAEKLSQMLDDKLDARDKNLAKELGAMRQALVKVMRRLGWKRPYIWAPPVEGEEQEGEESHSLRPPSLRERIQDVDWIHTGKQLGMFIGTVLAAAAMSYQATRGSLSCSGGVPGLPPAAAAGQVGAAPKPAP